MLSHLRRRAEETIARAHRVIFSTCGPAGIQTSVPECEALGLRLYVAVPLASDHLLNLEHQPSVVVLGNGWEMHATAQVVAPGKAPPALGLAQAPAVRWAALVEVRPARLHIGGRGGLPGETIDIDAGPEGPEPNSSNHKPVGAGNGGAGSCH